MKSLLRCQGMVFIRDLIESMLIGFIGLKIWIEYLVAETSHT